MRGAGKQDRLERILDEITTALNVLQRNIPELLAEARRRGGDEIRRRILEAAAEGGDDTPLETPRPLSRRSSSPGQRGFITPLLLRALQEAGAKGLKEGELLQTVRRGVVGRTVHRNSFVMALKRQTEAGQIVEIYGTYFSAEHADAATSGKQGEAGPTEPAPAEHGNLWSMGSEDAAA